VVIIIIGAKTRGIKIPKLLE